MARTSQYSRLIAGLIVTIFVLALMFFEQRIQQGIWFAQFTDETAALLGGKVLNSGGLLYRDFVDNHGPLLFLLTAAYGAVTGWADPNFARLIPAGFALLAAAGVFASPMLVTRRDRLLAASIFISMTASFWIYQGFLFVNYYTLSGSLAAIVLSVFVVPAWLGFPVSTVRGCVAGACTALLCFACYCYMPSAAAFAVSGVLATPRRGPGSIYAGYFGGLLVMSGLLLLWLLLNADFRGYLAFHIAFSQEAYAPFISFGLPSFLDSFRISIDQSRFVHSLGVLALMIGWIIAFGLSFRKSKRHPSAGPAACLVGLIGMLLLNARGSYLFQDGPFLMSGMALLALMLAFGVALLARRTQFGGAVATLAVLALLVAVELTTRRHASATPFAMRWRTLQSAPPELIARRDPSPFYEKIRAVVHPDEKFLALVFRPEMYWAADRLPISGFYEYLPWDAAYARNPWFGRPRDICVTLDAAPPPLVAFDNWVVWGQYVASDYAPCIAGILAKRYRKVPAFPTLYVRLDRWDGD